MVDFISLNTILSVDLILFIMVSETSILSGDEIVLFIAENLKKFRTQKNMTQEEVAETLSVSPQSVSKWERGGSLR